MCLLFWDGVVQEAHGKSHYMTSGICFIGFVASFGCIEKVFLDEYKPGRGGFIVVCFETRQRCHGERRWQDAGVTSGALPTTNDQVVEICYLLAYVQCVQRGFSDDHICTFDQHHEKPDWSCAGSTPKISPSVPTFQQCLEQKVNDYFQELERLSRRDGVAME